MRCSDEAYMSFVCSQFKCHMHGRNLSGCLKYETISVSACDSHGFFHISFFFRVDHFICTETELYRRRSNSIVDERALHELYLPPFKAGIDAGVGYVMTSYNRLNGEWAGQNADLIRRILRGELGFRGCVMSDWSSVNDTEKVVKSGQNVEMPQGVLRRGARAAQGGPHHRKGH